MSKYHKVIDDENYGQPFVDALNEAVDGMQDLEALDELKLKIAPVVKAIKDIVDSTQTSSPESISAAVTLVYGLLRLLGERKSYVLFAASEKIDENE